MLRKLFRYEFQATSRIYLPLFILLFGMAVVTRIFKWLATFSDIIQIPATLCATVFGMSVVGLFVLNIIIIIQRFYKNLMGDEGYLMFTLPVKPWQHIVSKLLVAIFWVVISSLVALLSIVVVLLYKDVFQQISLILKQITREYIFVFLELILVLLSSAASAILMLYASISIGQRVTQHRVIGSIVAYVVLNMAVQIVSTVALVILSLVNHNIVSAVMYHIDKIPFTEIIFLLAFFLNIFFGSVYYLITEYMLRKKLNLE